MQGRGGRLENLHGGVELAIAELGANTGGLYGSLASHPRQAGKDQVPERDPVSKINWGGESWRDNGSVLPSTHVNRP